MGRAFEKGTKSHKKSSKPLHISHARDQARIFEEQIKVFEYDKTLIATFATPLQPGA